VVASDKKNAFRVLNFKGKEQKKSLHGIVASINVVPQKKIVCTGYFSSHFE